MMLPAGTKPFHLVFSEAAVTEWAPPLGVIAASPLIAAVLDVEGPPRLRVDTAKLHRHSLNTERGGGDPGQAMKALVSLLPKSEAGERERRWMPLDEFFGVLASASKRKEASSLKLLGQLAWTAGRFVEERMGRGARDGICFAPDGSLANEPIGDFLRGGHAYKPTAEGRQLRLLHHFEALRCYFNPARLRRVSFAIDASRVGGKGVHVVAIADPDGVAEYLLSQVPLCILYNIDI